MIVTLRKDNQELAEIQMQKVSIRKAGPNDIQHLAELFRLATDDMIARNIGQWNYTYPLADHIQKDIENETCFVLEDMSKTVVATITLDYNQDDQYKKVGWNEYCKRPLVIHRLAVHPAYQGNGYGRQMMLFAEEYAKGEGVSSIRLDAYSLNPVSVAMYQSLGYRRAAGYCYFHGIPTPFYCFDKKMD